MAVPGCVADGFDILSLQLPLLPHCAGARKSPDMKKDTAFRDFQSVERDHASRPNLNRWVEQGRSNAPAIFP
jgi:hypothetical protein